jgi:hypothetical protein
MMMTLAQDARTAGSARYYCCQRSIYWKISLFLTLSWVLGHQPIYPFMRKSTKGRVKRGHKKKEDRGNIKEKT